MILFKSLIFRPFISIVADPSDLPTSSDSFRITLLAGNKSSALRVITRLVGRDPYAKSHDVTLWVGEYSGSTSRLHEKIPGHLP